MRKILFSFYIFLVCIAHGLNLELNRNNFDWKSHTILELIMLFIILFDIILIQYFLVKFVT